MDTDVVVVGAGPVGLMAALELRRHGIDVRIIDKLAQRPHYAKAVGVQPRTLELWAASGIVRPMLDAAITMRGQLMYRNGEAAGRIELQLPDDVPYGFVALPQYETERVLEQELRAYGTEVMTGVELISLAQKDDAVHSELRAEDGTESTLNSHYVIGCDGAHSAVRKELGADFSGDAFHEGYMLADVELDWSLPTGYAVRASHETDGETDDVLVCIPLPGHKRYRVSMRVAPDLEEPADTELEHGLRRTVRAAREGIGAGETDPARILAREAQLLVNYRDSRLVREDAAGGFGTGPEPGDRAPDAAGLRQSAVHVPIPAVRTAPAHRAHRPALGRFGRRGTDPARPRRRAAPTSGTAGPLLRRPGRRTVRRRRRHAARR